MTIEDQKIKPPKRCAECRKWSPRPSQVKEQPAQPAPKPERSRRPSVAVRTARAVNERLNLIGDRECDEGGAVVGTMPCARREQFGPFKLPRHIG